MAWHSWQNCRENDTIFHFTWYGCERFKVAIGPSIGKDQYEVDENVISHIDHNFKAKTVTQLNDHHYLLDLKQLNKEILLQNDVLASNIEITSYCTMTHQELFFSHRRDNGKTGRMLGFIG